MKWSKEMIHFNQSLVKKALETIAESKDLSDVSNDLNRINIALSAEKTSEKLLNARKLDYELRNKYPIIDKLLSIANRLPVAATNSQYRSKDLPEHANLVQDYFGILCHVLLKKQITTSIQQFIETVD